MSETSKIKERYLASYKKFGVGPKALRFRSRVAQEVRFLNLVADVDIEGKSVLDIGCGFGDIIPFISAKAKHFEYTGIDLVSEFIEIARKKHPEHEFIIGDYFGKPLQEKFDIVLTSGTLNSNVEYPMDCREKAIKIMFDHAKEAVVFNMAGSYPQPTNKEKYKVWYANSLEILKFCLSLSPKVIFRHHYRMKDFTLIIFK